jgi:G:T-mismatch repair DNA endonuclease (very short patch repair protein)
MIKQPAATTTCPDYFGMSRISAKNTKPEMLVRKFLHEQAFRYKLHDKKLSGKPVDSNKARMKFIQKTRQKFVISP